MKTKPDVFIIESLSLDDERHKRFEGDILSRILALSGKRCAYHYIRTEKELRYMLGVFTKSTYRYLHLSCHGNRSTMFATLDTIALPDFVQILRPHVKGRRVFLSACSIVSETLAQELIPKGGCFSLLGPDQDIRFDDAAVLWASLYHTMFAWDRDTMSGTILRRQAQRVANMYYVHLRYFGRDRTQANGFIDKRIIPMDEDRDSTKAKRSHPASATPTTPTPVAITPSS